MAKRLEGVDISHWNDFEKVFSEKHEFIIMKLTEGVSYIDPEHKKYFVAAEAADTLIGFYHYARAEKNSAKAEAEHFCNNIPKEALGNALLVLDFEGKALSIKECDKWALEFCLTVENITGVKPLIYCSQSVVKRFPSLAANNTGLWVARYRNKMLGYGDIAPWKFAALWQYTSQGIDRDIFFGSKEQFLKYCEVNK